MRRKASSHSEIDRHGGLLAVAGAMPAMHAGPGVRRGVCIVALGRSVQRTSVEAARTMLPTAGPNDNLVAPNSQIFTQSEVEQGKRSIVASY